MTHFYVVSLLPLDTSQAAIGSGEMVIRDFTENVSNNYSSLMHTYASKNRGIMDVLLDDASIWGKYLSEIVTAILNTGISLIGRIRIAMKTVGLYSTSWPQRWQFQCFLYFKSAWLMFAGFPISPTSVRFRFFYFFVNCLAYYMCLVLPTFRHVIPRAEYA